MNRDLFSAIGDNEPLPWLAIDLCVSIAAVLGCMAVAWGLV